ncbi:DeoR family transcriptional regulator [Mesorhizobium sp. NZP2234]|uniref:DeoR family transcriptional regulator n=1 Tax=Mesorhizobium sp. NZP2234 TaxID=2483402 RepID=UPI00155591EB|nr:DeoR family transcriptional regulator [Mesorhizobium sp. NZP2234]QKC89354.1 DeoR family transcriptional regulator [Mesorhizobium sp. NZP2234]
MLPKKGRKLPIWKGVLGGHDTYAKIVAGLLRKEHGDSHRAVKQLMRQTHASERTVKHWLSAQNGPDTVFFLRLVVSSPVIRAFVLGLIEAPASKPSSVQVDRFSLSAAREAYSAGESAFSVMGRDGRKYDPNRDPNRDPKDDPEPIELNERQHWFLSLVSEGGRCGAKEIMTIWQVSLKTARRDISGLQRAQLLEHIGSRRKGRYRRTVP